MPFFGDPIARRIREQLKELRAPIRLFVFKARMDCESCPSASALAQQLGRLSPLVIPEEFDLVLDPDPVEQYNIDRAPTLAIVGDADYGIRYVGTPIGMEIPGFIDTLCHVSRADSGLSTWSRIQLTSITRPLALDVLSCPT